MNEKELRQTFPAMLLTVQIARGALRQNRPHVIDGRVNTHFEALKTNEALSRLLTNRAEHTRVLNDVRRDISTAIHQAAAIALYPLRAAQQHVSDWREWTATTKREVALSFPRALHGVTPDGMIGLATLRELRRPVLQRASANDLLRTYQKAQARRQSAAAMLDSEIIEGMLDGAAGWAGEPKDLPVLRELREMIRECQDMRLPGDLPDYEGLDADIVRLWERASAAKINVIDPAQNPDAAAAYREQEAELRAVGAASDRDSIASVQLATAIGQ